MQGLGSTWDCKLMPLGFSEASKQDVKMVACPYILWDVIHPYFCRLTLVLEATVSWMWCFLALREDNKGGQWRALGQDGYGSLLKPQLLLAPVVLQTSLAHQDKLFLSAPLLLCSSLRKKPRTGGALFVVSLQHWLHAVRGGLWFHHLTRKSKKKKRSQKHYHHGTVLDELRPRLKPNQEHFQRGRHFYLASRKEKYESTG